MIAIKVVVVMKDKSLDKNMTKAEMQVPRPKGPMEGSLGLVAFGIYKRDGLITMRIDMIMMDMSVEGVAKGLVET